MDKGRYPDLAVVNKNKQGRRKKHFVPDYIAAKLKQMYQKISAKD